jgi:hypothetical protein
MARPDTSPHTPPASRKTSPGPASKGVRPAAAATATKQARLIVSIIGGLFLLLIVGFVSMVFFVQHEARLNPVGPIAAAPGAEKGGLVFQGTANIWEVRGRMTQGQDRQVHFSFDLIGPTGQPAPPSLDLALALDMPDQAQAPIALTHRLTGPGSYAASTTLPTPGRWRLRITFPEITGIFEFDA